MLLKLSIVLKIKLGRGYYSRHYAPPHLPQESPTPSLLETLGTSLEILTKTLYVEIKTARHFRGLTQYTDSVKR